MSCPAPESLSRWIDGSAEPAAAAAAARHAEGCADCRTKADALRAAAAWLETVAEPGPGCLGPDEMAALLEGRGSASHLEVCPRCAAEFKALRPAKKATQRIYRTRAGLAPWLAAAAALLVAVTGLALAMRRTSTEPATTAVAPPPPPPPPSPPLPPREPARDLEPPLPPPPTPAPRPVPPPPPATRPAPAPEVEPPADPPAPPPEPPKDPAPPRPTVTEPERKAVALTLKAGALSAQQGGRWVRTPRPEEGQTLRAEGRTVCEFAGAQLTIEASSRVAFEGFDLALHEGALSAEVAPGASFGLSLDARRVEPLAAASRVLLVARPDRLLVEEGAARSGETILHEGVEYLVRKDRIEPRKGRSLPAAARPRESLAWRLDFSQPALLRPRILSGRLMIEGEERAIAATALDQNPYWQSQVSYFTGDVQKPLFVVKPGTTIRFRYFLSEPAELELVMRNVTKDENFNKPLVSVVGRYTTVTLPVRDVPPNRGGKQAPCEVGDRYVSWGLFCGRPGSRAQLYVDQFEVLEVER